MNSHVAQVAQVLGLAQAVEFRNFEGKTVKSFIQVELMDVKTDVQQDPVLGSMMHDENDGTV